MTISQLLRNRPTLPHKETVRRRISIPLGLAMSPPQLLPSWRKMLTLPNYVTTDGVRNQFPLQSHLVRKYQKVFWNCENEFLASGLPMRMTHEATAEQTQEPAWAWKKWLWPSVLEIKAFTYVGSRCQKCYICYKNQALNFWSPIAWPTTKKAAFKICRMTSSWDKLNIAPTGLVRWNLPFWLSRFAAHRPWKSQGSVNIKGHKINAETAQAALLMGYIYEVVCVHKLLHTAGSLGDFCSWPNGPLQRESTLRNVMCSF